MARYLFQRGLWHPDGVSPERAWWGPKEALIGLGLAIVLAGVLGLALSPVSVAFDSDDPVSLGLGAGATLAFELGLLLIVYRMTIARGSGASQLGLTGAGWKASASFFSLVACYASLYAYVGAIKALGVPGLEPAAQLPTALFDYPAVVAVVGVSVVLVAPITEELFFRGFFFRGLSNGFGVLPAALASGFIFSLAHLNPGAIIPFTLIGAIFAISYQRTGSLLTPIASHFAFNLISFSILVLVPEARG